jgi:hypothetical protein
METGGNWDRTDALLILREILIKTGETLHEIHGQDPEDRFTDIWDQVSEFNNVEDPHL